MVKSLINLNYLLTRSISHIHQSVIAYLPGLSHLFIKIE